VATNTEDIEALNDNSVNQVEFQYKDELVRSTVKNIEEKQGLMADDIKEVKAQLDKIDQRLYELSRN